MNISIISQGFTNWGGGIDFIRYIAASIAIAKMEPTEQRYLILPGDDTQDEFSIALRKIKIIRQFFNKVENGSNNFNHDYLKKTFDDLKNQICTVQAGSSQKSQIEKAKKIGANVLLPCLTPVNDVNIAWVGYLYDFQHRRIPDLFSAASIKKRDAAFKKMLFKSRHIIVNSKSVADDANIYFDKFPAELHALPFSPCPQINWFNDDKKITSQYNINKPYFIISNQFWKHKDHTTAILAFSEYLSCGGDALLICTGSTHDFRFPSYFDELKSLIHKLYLNSHVKILGHIPKTDQIDLVKNAIALIQPTLFEGGPGGGAVYDAIALGTPVIVSNIPVNMEINCGEVTYFEASNPSELAIKMLEQCETVSSPKNTTKLIQQGLERRLQCGEAILNIARKTYFDFAAERK